MSTTIQNPVRLGQLFYLCGDNFELLERLEKIELRILLTHFIYGREATEDYSINEAWIDSQLHQTCSDERICRCAEILEGIEVDEAESLLSSLQNLCTTAQ